MACILVVEDSPTHTALMKSLLVDAAHQVDCATNGREALDRLEKAQAKASGSNMPDLVVTDLRMPEVNGQELVQEISKRFPQLPTVVVTARGSENLAVDALALGAANFVPKNLFSKLLVRVIRQTLELSRCDSIFRGFNGQLTRPEFSFTLKNDLSSIEPAVLYLVQSLAASTHLNPTQRIRVGTAAASALFSAMCYGNLELQDDEGSSVTRLLSGEDSGIHDLNARAAEEPFAKRSVSLKVSIDQADTRVLVSHSGPGRLTRMSPAPGTPESFELEQCRGLMLMTSFMDDVIFQSGYSEVVMVKNHEPLG
ncbi:MAG: response regulator [Rubripirellula sp.]